MVFLRDEKSGIGAPMRPMPLVNDGNRRLAIDEFLAVLDEKSLSCRSYALTCEVVNRSIGVLGLTGEVAYRSIVAEPTWVASLGSYLSLTSWSEVAIGSILECLFRRTLQYLQEHR